MTDHTTHFDDAQAFAAFDARLPNTVANQTVTMEVGRALLTLEAERDALRSELDALGIQSGQALLTAIKQAEKAEQERDALRLRVASLEAAALRAKVQLCCPPQDMLDAAAALMNAHSMLAGDTTALRAMLVEAAKQAQFFECEACGATDAPLWRGSHPQHAPGCDGNCGSSCPVECGPTKPRGPEAIADRILGASKEGE